MSEYKRIFLLLLIMMVVTVATGGVAIGVLYRTAFNEQRSRLVEIAQSQARLIEAVARFDQAYSYDYPEGAKEATLSQLHDAHAHYVGFGETGEFTLAKRDGDNIVFLLNHRHGDLDELQPVPFHSRLAEPMRRAPSGRSGTVVGLDYRGVTVLAAYEPIAVLDLGIVAKIDLAEIRAPFLRAGGIVLSVALVLITVGTVLFFSISNPMLRRLRESEATFRGITTAAQDAIFLIDMDGKIAYCNPVAQCIFGYSEKEYLGKDLHKLLSPSRYHPAYLKGFKKFWETGTAPVLGKVLELEAVRKDGKEFPVELSVAALTTPDGRAAVGVVRDITERKQITQELSRRLEEQRGLNLILRAIQDAQTPTQILEIAVERVLHISWLGMKARAAAFLLRGQQLHKVVSRNLSPAVDLSCARLALGECLCGRVAETGKPIICAHVNEYAPEDHQWHYHAKGMADHGHAIFPFKWKSQVMGVLCFYVAAGDELDDRRSNFLEAVTAIVATAIGHLNYQSQLAQSDRLSSMGLLAAGVAHEIKNPLGLVLTNVEWLEEHLPSILEHTGILRQRVIDAFGAEHASTLLRDLEDLRNDELLHDMAQCTRDALDGVRRASTIVRDLGIFSRTDDNQLSVVSLVDVLERAITLSQNEIKYRARITRDFKQTLPVLANEGRLSQVFLNLLVNAAQAIDKGDPEKNEIRVRLWHEGEEVIAEVKDTGKGIAPSDLPHVFEPFFTTKEQEVGTGLGLYISNNIVTSLGGHIDVESTAGRGTRFVAHLPAAAPLAPGSIATPGEKVGNPIGDPVTLP
jgi:PAS domain S-box-containing protein